MKRLPSFDVTEKLVNSGLYVIRTRIADMAYMIHLILGSSQLVGFPSPIEAQPLPSSHQQSQGDYVTQIGITYIRADICQLL